jgi:hypothetical protein
MKYNHDDIDKIKSDVLPVCQGLVLEHHVKLSTKSESGERVYFHKEYDYQSTAYNGVCRLVSVKLNFKSYLILNEVGKDAMFRESVYINQKYKYKIIRSLNKVIKWLYDDNIFLVKNGKLEVNATNKKEVCLLFENSKITLIPTLIDNNKYLTEAIAIRLNESDSIFKLDIDDIAALRFELEQFNFHQSALSAISYLGSPDLGKYNMSISNTNTPSEGIFTSRTTPTNTISDMGLKCKTSETIEKPVKKSDW